MLVAKIVLGISKTIVVSRAYLVFKTDRKNSRDEVSLNFISSGLFMDLLKLGIMNIIPRGNVIIYVRTIGNVEGKLADVNVYSVFLAVDSYNLKISMKKKIGESLRQKNIRNSE